MFVAAILLALTVDPPEKLPSVALSKSALYKLEVFLLIVYASLLTLTPLFYGVVRGRLPIEISARGAKWEEVSGSLKETEDRIGKLERAIKHTGGMTLRNRLEIDELKQRVP